MSLKGVEVKLNTLGMKNDVAALEALVCSLEDEKVIPISSVMACLIHYLHYPFLGIRMYRKNRRRFQCVSPSEEIN
jgi:hypothetical protein